MEQSDLFEKINQGVLRERLRAISRNISANKKLIDQKGGLAPVVNQLSGKHCVVVGAGASLPGQMPLLKRISNDKEIVMIAADMAFLPCVNSGVVPEFAVSCETTPRDFFSAADTSCTSLLAFSGVNPRIAREWRGNLFFYNWMIHSPEYEALWKNAGTHLGFAATGSIVTTQAVSIALGCGIRSLALVGNDLGFRDIFYSPGTIRSGDFLRMSSRISPVSSTEMSACRRARRYEITREKKYYTNNQFLAAKKWLEKLFAETDCMICDCSEPGCSGENIEKISFEEYLKKIGKG